MRYMSLVPPSNGILLTVQSAAPPLTEQRWYGTKRAHHYGERQTGGELECSEVLIESA